MGPTDLHRQQAPKCCCRLWVAVTKLPNPHWPVGSNTAALSVFFKNQNGPHSLLVSFLRCEVETVVYGCLCSEPSDLTISFLLHSFISYFPVPKGTECRQAVGTKDMNGFRCLHCTPHCLLHPHQRPLTIHISIRRQCKAISAFPTMLVQVLPVSTQSHVSIFRCSLRHFPSPGIKDTTRVPKGLAWGELPPLAGPPGWSVGTGSCIACVCTGLRDQPVYWLGHGTFRGGRPSHSKIALH